MEVLGDGEIEEGIPTLKGMLRMRKTSLEWSPPVPLSSMIGIDGSLLALGNRAGWVELWSYDVAFSHQLAVQLPRPFATELTWSAWQVVDDETCEFDNIRKQSTESTEADSRCCPARRCHDRRRRVHHSCDSQGRRRVWDMGRHRWRCANSARGRQTHRQHDQVDHSELMQ